MKIFKDDGLKTEMTHLNFFQANSFGKKFRGDNFTDIRKF